MNRSFRPAAARLLFSASLLLLAASLLGAEDRTERGPDPRGSREKLFRDNVLVEERVYAPDAAILEDILYKAGKLWESRSYIRSLGALRRVEMRNAEGAVVGELVYVYDTSGGLLRVDASGSFGDSSAGMLDSGSPPLASWTIQGKTLSLVRYDPQGRPVLSVTAEDGKPIATRGDSYGRGPLPSRTVVKDAASGQTRSTDYDAAGRPLVVVVDGATGRISRSDYRYDSSGRLVEERSREGPELLSRRLAYGATGVLEREEYRSNGTLSKIILRPGEDRVEELFNDGAMFVRVRFSQGRKVEEEFFVDGKVAWTRKYP
ncbi:MAG TPA: hypothetical protein VMV90_09535 [Rectinemataceae bacterium]|nr:hypothetical protein [Rectinemataceae bacterium]